jgi:hypothetical protein
MTRSSRIKLTVCLLAFVIASALCTGNTLARDPTSRIGLAAGAVLLVFSVMLVWVVFLVPGRD